MIFPFSFRCFRDFLLRILGNDLADDGWEEVVEWFAFAFSGIFGFEDVGGEEAVFDVVAEEEGEGGSEAEGSFFMVACDAADDACFLEFAEGAVYGNGGQDEVLEDFGDGGHTGDEEVEDYAACVAPFIGQHIFQQVSAQNEFQVILGGVSGVAVDFKGAGYMCGAHM